MIDQKMVVEPSDQRVLAAHDAHGTEMLILSAVLINRANQYWVIILLVDRSSAR